MLKDLQMRFTPLCWDCLRGNFNFKINMSKSMEEFQAEAATRVKHACGDEEVFDSTSSTPALALCYCS